MEARNKPMRKMLLAAVATAPLLALGACAGEGVFEDTAAADTAIGTEAEVAAVDAGPGWGMYDADRNRMLTRTEYGAIGDDFARIDEDASGIIEEDEYANWAETNWGPEYETESAGLFDAWDDNDDLGLTEDEWGDEEEFFLWDDDRSGVLETDEGWL